MPCPAPPRLIRSVDPACRCRKPVRKNSAGPLWQPDALIIADPSKTAGIANSVSLYEVVTA